MWAVAGRGAARMAGDLADAGVWLGVGLGLGLGLALGLGLGLRLGVGIARVGTHLAPAHAQGERRDRGRCDLLDLVRVRVRAGVRDRVGVRYRVRVRG